MSQDKELRSSEVADQESAISEQLENSIDRLASSYSELTSIHRPVRLWPKYLQPQVPPYAAKMHSSASKALAARGPLPAHVNLRALGFTPGMLRLAQWMAKNTAVQDGFARAGFVPSQFVPEALQQSVRTAYSSNATPQDLAKIVESYYDDHPDAVASIIDRLQASADFRPWSTELTDVLAARDASLDSITIYPLALMIEGIVGPLVEAVYPAMQSQHDKAKERARRLIAQGKPSTHQVYEHRFAYVLSELLNATTYSVSLEGSEQLLEYLEQHVFKSTKGSSASTPDPQHAERHPLAHGKMGGTRVATLRCLLLLDMLAILLPEVRDTVQKSSNLSASVKQAVAALTPVSSGAP